MSTKEVAGSGGIRTHASEETGALNQRLRPLGHATLSVLSWDSPAQVPSCPESSPAGMKAGPLAKARNHPLEANRINGGLPFPEMHLPR